MLNENIKKLRKAKGLSQEELAISLNVVRQTVSKWEKGLSVPDSEMLLKLANELDTTVNILLDETIEAQILTNKTTDKQTETKRKALRCIFLIMATVATLSIAIYAINELYYYLFLMHKFNSSVSVIGGAEGPTAIFVASYSFNKIISICLPAIIIAIASWVGFYKTKRK